MSEAHEVLDTAESVALRIRSREVDLPRQAIPLLRRAEGFLLAARSSSLAGRWRATVTFSRIAEAEFRRILRRYGDSVIRMGQVPLQPPQSISVIPLPPGGPL